MTTINLPGRGSVAYQWTGDGPETVVLISGSVFNYHQWDRQALPILQRGLGGRCRFLQYDYVGVGGSSIKTAPFNMFDLADELAELLQALAVGPAHLLGISKGSLVGQAFVIRYRERVRSFAGLGNPNLLAAGASEAFSPFTERLEALETLRPLWSQRVDRKNVSAVFNQVYVPALFGVAYSDLSLMQRLRAALVRRMVYPALEGTFIQTMVDLFRYYVEGIDQEAPDFAAGLPAVRDLPVLLLNGTADTTTPVTAARELAKVIPGAELIEFEGITHMGPMLLEREGRPVFEAYVTWLNRLLDKAESGTRVPTGTEEA
jgi:pimeloyl-ACP methyl ester carboxylesterase